MEVKKAFQECFAALNIQVHVLQNKVILITGAAGMIGRMIIKGLAVLNELHGLSLTILALVRDTEKAKILFASEIQSGILKLVSGDVCDDILLLEKVDYIIHTASITQSESFIQRPVEVIRTNVEGTRHVLELARRNCPCRVVYLSSMEVYGFTEEEELLREDTMKYLNPLTVRSCYPESKRMAENLCVSYVAEYGVPVTIIRLAQTFGYGVEWEDGRVFAEFARCAIKHKDIVLLTEGSSKRMYLDTFDAVGAILTVMLKGESGRAYNAANKDTYCSIKDMAQMVADRLGCGDIKVKMLVGNGEIKKYSPSHRYYLDVSEIESLGWRPLTDLEEMYRRLIESMKKE